MNTKYKNNKGVIKSAEQWIDDMGGIECLVGRPLFGAPSDDLISDIMAENGLVRLFH